MAYLGTTSTAPNVPSLVTQAMYFASSNVTGVAGLKYGFPRTWVYASTHLDTEIAASATGFFGKDATRLGMQPGDMLIHYPTSGGALNHAFITASTTLPHLGVGTVFCATA